MKGKQSKAKREQLVVKAAQQNTQEIQRRYSLKRFQHITKPHLKCDLSIAVVGKTGVGKSATANAILGDELFQESVSLDEPLPTPEWHRERVDDRKICIMEVPSLLNVKQLDEQYRPNICSKIKTFCEKAHAVVYVFNLASPRFTKEDKSSLAAIEVNRVPFSVTTANAFKVIFIPCRSVYVVLGKSLI
ncbi:GTPase IMAP family member 7 [Holothuria leucospilota]|uniref:GTPase IMAP family member 7 n=1 Tax=Holothuria leucospilota TaxID=206669 RepID=A0A9Q0YR84_HOLLE|nr:GTPase IMAP family member 7 [Holothuria leucospilota]